MSDHLTTAREHLGFCIDELVLAQGHEETASLIQIACTLSIKIKDLQSEEKAGHFGYTSKDGEDFENQEVDRMSDDMIAEHEEDSEAYLNAEGLL